MKQVVFAASALFSLTLACAPAIRSTATAPLTPREIAELWQNPGDLSPREVFWGPWGEKYAPTAAHTYKLLELKTSGFSPGMDVVDENGVEWSVKQGPEASTEVILSRILSAVGYHQPPIYYLGEWTLRDGDNPGPQKPGRFRPKIKGIDAKEPWSWHQNPFVGTDPYGGLLALLMLFNSSDLKDDNNMLYELAPGVGPSELRHMYVVRDLGASLGETGRIEPRRGDPFVFAKTGFIEGVDNGIVQFDYHGRHQELFRQVTPEHVRWMAQRVSKLSDRQWREAFTAGGYAPGTIDMYLEAIHKRLDQVKKLPS
jgi:hypothetical protein